MVGEQELPPEDRSKDKSPDDFKIFDFNIAGEASFGDAQPLVGSISHDSTAAGEGIKSALQVSAQPQTPSNMQQLANRDLFAMYENLSSNFQDLTFNDLCSPTPGYIMDIESVSLDPMVGLAAAPTRLSADVEHEETKLIQTPDVNLRTISIREKDIEVDTNIVSETGPRMSIVSRNNSVQATARFKSESTRSFRLSESRSTNHKGSKKMKPPGGAPHTNFCATCSKYIIFFKTRCLVCGKCYCASCLKDAMGSMAEGRKCKDCLGQRYSERYINRAGKGWTFMFSNQVKMIEIQWAKKKPKKSYRDLLPRRRSISCATPSKNMITPYNNVHSWELQSRITNHNASKSMSTTPPCSPRKSSSYCASPVHGFFSIGLQHPDLFHEM